MSDSISSTFSVPLASRAHQQAEQFRRQQTDAQKAKQVYLNTLAVYAVKYYLECLGIATDWEASHSWHPDMQTLLDIADLQIPHRGSLECRPLLPGTQACRIPAEVRHDLSELGKASRIGYVLVQFNESLTGATLLGFSPTAPTETLGVNQLRSLDELPGYLSSIAPVRQTLVNLRQWVDGLFEASWQTMETFLAAQSISPAFSFRNGESINITDLSQPETQTRGVKLIQLEQHSLAFLVSLIPEENPLEHRVRVLFQVHPASDRSASQSADAHLPEGLQLLILSETGQVLQKVEARGADDYIQKQLIGTFGERFSVKIALGDASCIEDFVI